FAGPRCTEPEVPRSGSRELRAAAKKSLAHSLGNKAWRETRPGIDLEAEEDASVRRQTKVCGVLSFQLCSDGFFHVLHKLIERLLLASQGASRNIQQNKICCPGRLALE